jgi:anti-sigma B factor antagonist
VEFHHWHADRASLVGMGSQPGGSFRPVLGLRVEVDERDATTVLVVSGELDLGSSPRLRDAAVRQLLAGDRRLIIDLTGLEFLDSTGLGVIVAVLKRARTLGAELHLVIGRERVRAPFQITGVDGLLPIHDDLDAALAAAAGAPSQP